MKFQILRALTAVWRTMAHPMFCRTITTQEVRVPDRSRLVRSLPGELTGQEKHVQQAVLARRESASETWSGHRNIAY